MSQSEAFTKAGIDVSKVRGTSGKTLCPKCSQDRKNKKDLCLSVDIEKGVYNCHHCDYKGTVNQVDYEPRKVYFKPVFNNRTNLSKAVVDYFATRCIGQDTLIKLKITAGDEWMPQKQKQVNTIQFNYFRDSELVNVKYRDAEKNFKLVKDAELVFYNLNAIENTESCIITEGEIDALSFIEAGINEVISVPNGASKGSQKLEYLDNCYNYFESKQLVIIATDNDEPGIILRDELARRIGYEKCVWIDFADCKDANDYLKKYGPEKLKALTVNKHEFPIEGVFTIEDVWPELEDVYLNGLPTGAKTGDPEFDKHLGIMPGELTMVTGIPSHGKSIFLDQISLKLCLNADWSFAVCSPESYPVHIYYSRLIKRLLGKKFTRQNISQLELQISKDWINNHYSLIAPPAGYNLDEILAKARFLVLKKGIKGLIIDPWNRIEQTAPAGGERRWINEQLDKIVRFNQQNKVHTFLVAHPTKMEKEKRKDGSLTSNFLVPNLYSISGSGDFFNMTQNGMTIFRNYDTGNTEIYIQKVKWEHLGKTGMITYKYHEENARFYLDGQEDPEKNWLIDPVQAELFHLKPVYNRFEQSELTPEMSDKPPPF